MQITAYTKENISTNYSIKIGYTNVSIDLWNVDSEIKIITNWTVSIEPRCLNRIAKILRFDTKLNTKYGEYNALMEFLTKPGTQLFEFN